MDACLSMYRDYYRKDLKNVKVHLNFDLNHRIPKKGIPLQRHQDKASP